MKKTKTVFEGVINGQTFDNVKEYNKVLCECLEKGESVDAQTSTRTVPVDVKCEYNENVEMLPGFEIEDNCDYIDDYIKETQEETTAAIRELKESLGDKLESILYKLDDMDYNELAHYDEEVCDVIDTINNDLDYVNNSKEILKVWKDFYTSISNAVYDKLELDNDEDESKKIVSNDNEVKAKQLENDLVNAFTKLVNQVPALQNIINSLGLK